MADFNAHAGQASNNLAFLEKLNDIPEQWDWKVTICFYVCVHIVNAHLARVGNLHYRQHVEVEQALNFENSLSPAKLSQEVFLAYRKLKNLSRRSRYLCSENPKANPEEAFMTKPGDFTKALKQLDTLLTWFTKEYSYNLLQRTIYCPAPKADSPFFIVKDPLLVDKKPR